MPPLKTKAFFVNRTDTRPNTFKRLALARKLTETEAEHTSSYGVVGSS